MYSNRISTAARYDLLTADIQKNEANFNRLTAQLASGKKITSITDDPIGAVNIINTNRQLGQIETFNNNIGMGMAELENMDDLLDLAGGYLSQAWDKAVQANNGSYGVSSLQALKVEIDEIAKTMVDLANTEFNDSFVFGGANSKLTPYTIDENGDITYHGTPYSNPEHEKRTEVADGIYEVVNTTGDKVFGYYRAATNDANTFTAPDGRRVIKEGDVYKYENGNLYNTGLDGSDLVEHYDDKGVFDYYISPEGKKVIKEEAEGTREVTSTIYKDASGNQYNGDIADLTPVDGEDGVYTDASGTRYAAEQITSTETYTYDLYKFMDGGLYGHGKDSTGLTQGAEEECEGIMGTLRKLSNSIQAVIDAKNSGDSDAEVAGYSEMNATLDMFKKSMDTMTTEQTKFGGVYNRLEMTESTLETNNENLTSYLSQLQNVDLAKAISDWYQAQYAYQASLQVAASSMGMSLLNYL